MVRSGIALSAASAVGLLGVAAPTLAATASSQAAVPARSLVSSDSIGTAEAFAARATSTDRSAERATLSEDDVVSAVGERAAELTAVSEQVADTQQGVALESRTATLTSTGTAIDAEAERLKNEGKFFWPTAGSITSEWGMRLHPILKYYRMHAGADIGGECGAPIYAAADGVVTSVQNEGQGGNAVRVDHGTIRGNAVMTAYLHTSAFKVTVGQKVKRGQLIALVGSTGLSTACHLHFAVYENGNNINPRTYLER